MNVKVPQSKAHAGDNPWLTFEGAEPESIKKNVIEAFNLDPENADLPLFQVVINAQGVASKIGKVAHDLGGTVLSVQHNGSTPSASATTPETPAVNLLLAKVEEQTTVADLQRLWAENKANFDADSSLMAAYKAKGKSLMAA